MWIRVFFGIKLLGSTWQEIAIQVVSVLSSSNLLFIVYLFYRQSIIDVDRKLYLMRQLTMMLKSKSVGRRYSKILPTINLMDPSSLRTWLNIRRLCLEYGKKFFYRHEIFLPVNIFIMIGCFTIVVVVLSIEKMNFAKDNQNDLDRLIISLLVDAMIFCLVSFHFVFLAGAINDEFQAHIGSIERNRLLVHSLFAQRGFYFRDLGLASASKLQADSATLAGGLSDSYIREKLAAELLSLLPSTAGDEEECRVEETVVSELETVVGVYDEVLEGLRHD